MIETFRPAPWIVIMILRRFVANGFCLMMSAALGFALSDILMKTLSSDFHSTTIALFRFLVGGLILWSLLSWRGESLRGTHTRGLILRGFIGTVSYFCILKAMALTTLANTIVLLYTSPLFVVLFSFLFFRESVRWAEILLAVTGFLGITILVNPSFHTLNMGYVFGLLSGCTGGLATLLIPKLRKTNGPLIIYFYFCLVGGILSFPFAMGEFKLPTLQQGLLLVSVGLVLLIAHLFMNQGFKFCKASEGSVIMMSEIVFAGIGGAVLFHDAMTPRFWIGAVLIVGSGVGLNLIRHPSRSS
jgi:drug/metabolite transporter (DMT)-like permease